MEWEPTILHSQYNDHFFIKWSLPYSSTRFYKLPLFIVFTINKRSIIETDLVLLDLIKRVLIIFYNDTNLLGFSAKSG